LPFRKTFEQFDFGFQPSIDEKQIRELRTLRFVHEASNVILLGPPGVGKTHLSVALAEAAIQSGFGAYFMTAHDLVTDLGRAYREGRRKAGLFPRAEEETRPAPFPSSGIIQNGPRRQGSAPPRKTRAPLTAPGRSGDGS